MYSPSTSSSSRSEYFKRTKDKKKFNNKLSYFVPPSRVSLPQFPVPKDLTAVVFHHLKPFPGMTQTSMQYLAILDKIKNCPEFRTKESNHLQILKVMLYLEEIQNNLDMRRYDQSDRYIERVTPSSEYFKIYVEGLNEDCPSIRPGDVIEIRDPNTKTLFLLTATNIMNDYIVAVAGQRFCKDYSPSKGYSIRFRFQNYPLRCCHLALYLINSYRLTSYFFPLKRTTYNEPSKNEDWFNKTIESNNEQKQAVLNILGRSSFPAPYILYGPPGTGKTATLVEAICQVWQKNPSEHILVCTPSNAAADVITKRLLYYNPNAKKNIFRMYSPSKEGSKIDNDIVECSNYVDGQIMMLPKELIILKNIVILTLCASTRLLFLELREKHFSYVFIDEAGQATEPESMMPFNLLSSNREGRSGILHGQVIIAGDPQQLGPGIRSKLAEPILGKSLLERLMECEPYRKNEHGYYNPSYITKLLKNYRSHPTIIQVSNELFYDNELIACENNETRKAENWPHLVKKKFPIIFHGVDGDELKDYKSPSSYNLDEIKIVMQYIRLLMNQGMNGSKIAQKNIGIVTPFSAQKQKLQKALETEKLGNIEVGTVELLQGQEKDVIILTSVRSKTFCHDERVHIGFLSNPKRFNVALTRAKALLIVVGNPTVLQTDKHWCYLLNFCKQNGACRGKEFDIPLDIQIKLQDLRISDNSAKNYSSAITDSALQVIEIDKGVDESSDSSMIDENEYPSTTVNVKKTVQVPFNNYVNKPSTNKYVTTYKSANIPTQQLLSDVIVIKTEYELKQEKQAAKKNKKNKNKNSASDNF